MVRKYDDENEDVAIHLKRLPRPPLAQISQRSAVPVQQRQAGYSGDAVTDADSAEGG